MLTRQSTQTQITPRQLTVEELELEKLPIPVSIRNGLLVVERSARGALLKTPVSVCIEKVLAVREKGLIAYILQSFASTRPVLIPYVFDNQSLVRMARHFLRYCSGSPMSLYAYTNDVAIYSRFLGHSPDMIVGDVKNGGKIADQLKLQNHTGFLEEYLANLQDDGLSPGRVHGAIKHVRTFYKVNGVDIKLQQPLKPRVIYKDKAPQPEELARLLDVADLRQRAILSVLTLGGLREETLSRLQYRHVREDMEKHRIPVHIHVEAELTKGKYGDYDTFIGAEAVEYLSLYLRERRQGSRDKTRGNPNLPPEVFDDISPLIRDATSSTPRAVGPKAIARIVRNLYSKAGLVKPTLGRMYELRVHTLRKYFKTQLLALGVQPDYVDYMMGHTVDTYHDIQSLGVEKLRQAYAASGLSIRPKTRISKIEMIKEIIRAQGINPEQILVRDASEHPATTYQDPTQREDRQLQLLSRTLKELIQEETHRLASAG